MSWTALIPLKAAGDRKSRLADRLSAEARERLSRQLFDHVAGVLSAHPAIASVLPLSTRRPEGWTRDWLADEDRGLNPALMTARASLGLGPLLVIHADLPLLSADGIDRLLEGGDREGLAIAPDRHLSGTNALAIADGRPFDFRFGPDSFAIHRRQAGERCAVIEHPGLGLDLDTGEDLDAAIAAGFLFDA